MARIAAAPGDSKFPAILGSGSLMDSDYLNLLNEDLCKLKLLLKLLITENFTANYSSLRCLNLACGRADESGILNEILAPLSASIEIIGIDIRERELETARTRWKSDPLTSYIFLNHDATKLHLIAELAQPFDIIILRHQNFWNGAQTWKNIYDSALKRLSATGILVITSYFDQEHIQAMEAIQSLGATLIKTMQNQQSRILMKSPLKSVDRHIALFKKTMPLTMAI